MTLLEYREWKRLTQHQMAAIIGLSQPYLAQIESGSRPCSREAAIKIRSGTGKHVTFDDLLLREAGV